MTISAQILIPKTAGYLEVLLKASDHKQLFELLRGLGQGVKLSRVEATGYQEISCPLRGALNQNRGLDLNKSPLIEEITNELHCSVAKEDVLLDPLAAQV